MSEMEFIKFDLPATEEERIDIENRCTGMGFTRCPDSSRRLVGLYFKKERCDEAWIAADQAGTIAVNWPYHWLLAEFAKTKAIYWKTVPTIPSVVYDVELGMSHEDLKNFLTEWQEYRRKHSREVEAKVMAANA